MRSLAVFSSLAVLACATASAAPITLVHQARLLDPVGMPLQGPQIVVLSLLPGQAGAPVWSESQTLTAEDGFVQMVLGADPANPISGAALDGDLWISLTVNGTSMAPQRLAAVPRAVHADSAGGLVAGTVAQLGAGSTVGGAAIVAAPDLALEHLVCAEGAPARFDAGTGAWICGGYEALDRDDLRIAYVGTWLPADLAWGANRLSASGGYYTSCTGSADCSADSVTLSLDNNAYRSVQMSHLDWSNTRYFDVWVSFDGGVTYRFSKRVNTWHHPSADNTDHRVSQVRTLATNLPLGANVRVRVQGNRGRIHFDGFGLSRDVLGEEVGDHCPPTWASSADGRYCMDPAIRPVTDYFTALSDCRDEGAHVCTYNEVQTMCYAIGDAAYAGSVTGWYGDHAQVVPGGNTDDEFLTWNFATCNINNDGPAYQVNATFAYKCCM